MSFCISLFMDIFFEFFPLFLPHLDDRSPQNLERSWNCTCFQPSEVQVRNFFHTFLKISFTVIFSIICYFLSIFSLLSREIEKNGLLEASKVGN